MNAIASMTGFARRTGSAVGRTWSWEAKSVNGRGLEMRFRTPSGYDHLEPICRTRVAESFKRGNFNFILNLGPAESAASFRLNEANLKVAVEAVKKTSDLIKCEKPRPEGVLALKGVLEQEIAEGDNAEQKELDELLVAGFVDVIGSLGEARIQEGEKLFTIVDDQISEIDRLTNDAAKAAKDATSQFRYRLSQQFKELLGEEGFDDQRLAQEAAALAIKCDVREELDRLTAHIEAARELLSSGGVVGRRLDFLTQELNREANTLCSKAPEMTLKRIGLDMKSVVDQIREQAQNIE